MHQQAFYTLQPQTNAQDQPWRLFLFMAAVSIGYFVVQLDVSIVNLSLPAMRTYFNIDIAMLQWIADIYTLSLSILLLSAGILGDNYGSRRLLIIGYAIFFASSFMCGMAPSIEFMLVARFLQGIGAAMIVPNSLALINASFAKNDRLRLLLFAIWMSFGGVALTCGPIFGGVITAFWSWRYIFLINLPVCLLGIWLVVRYVEPTPTRRKRNQDWRGQCLLLVLSTVLLVLIINGGDLSFKMQILLLVTGLIAGVVLFTVERRCDQPAIPLDAFATAGLQRAIIYGFLVNFIYFGIVFFTSLYLRTALKMTSLEVGLAFIPITLPLIFSNLCSGTLSSRYGPDIAINIGFALLIPAMFYLALPSMSKSYWLMFPGFMLFSAGVGFITPMLTAIALRAVGPERSGTISAVVNFFRQLAGALGVAVFGLFMRSNNGEASYHDFGVALCLLGCAALVTVLMFSQNIWRQKPIPREN